MTEVGKFTQPDTSPDFFIEFLDSLDKSADIERLRAALAQHLRLAPGKRVLDLGCGIGGGTIPLAEVTGSSGLVAGVDVSSALIEVATRRAGGRPGIEFRLGDAAAIPYPDAFFDAARCERVFLYLPDRLAALHEMRRVVKPGGPVCIMDTEADSTSIYSADPALTRKMISLASQSIPNPNSARELPTLAKEAGLRAVETQTFAVRTPHAFMLRVMAGALNKAAETGMVARAEVDAWLNEQAALEAAGNFFQAWLFVLVSGVN
jgi:ubiquinone/menaquinone biosynthesis C-methylase UbiE